ncbi:MAG: MFS transporter [Pirellulales bacterium]|nr:MFS transporter [Pirellulales bacterium]
MTLPASNADANVGIESGAVRVGYMRWIICSLLFLGTVINYIDRTVLSVLEPELRRTIGWNDVQWGYIGASFMMAYAIGFPFAGYMMDKLGTRLGFTISLIVWSLAAASTAFARNLGDFVVARFALGLGESGNYPAAIKTIAEWFPQRERALATGIINAGTNVGATITPIAIPIIYANHGWQAAFLATGLGGLLWILLWWPIYRRPQEHPWLSRDEVAFIERDPPDPPQRIAWRQLLGYHQVWAFAIAKALTDSVGWFYLFWFAPFMYAQFGVDIKTILWPMLTVCIMADVDSVLGGWQSSWLLGRGWSTNAARKTAMLTYALCIVPVAAAPLVSEKWLAVILIGVAAGSHQGFSANLFTINSDIFPRKAIGSIIGIGGFAGAMGGFTLQLGAGWLKQVTGSYVTLFAIAGSAYVLALVILQILIPRIEPVNMAAEAERRERSV